MGLLSRINNSVNSSPKSDTSVVKASDTGLLARAQTSACKTYSSFQEWAKSKGFTHCGIFTLVHGMMVITHAYGLDSQTIANSVSSKDFWQGILDKNPVLNYSKKDNELYNFLQFFSFDLKSSINHISLLKIEKGSYFSVLLVYNTDEDKEINLTESTAAGLKYEPSAKLDSSKINISASNYLYSVSFEDLVKNAIKSIQLPEANITKAVIKCISEEIFDLLKCAFPAPNTVFLGASNNVNLSLTNKILDETLMKNHLNLFLSETLNKASQLPVLNNCGSADTIETVTSFLEK